MAMNLVEYAAKALDLASGRDGVTAPQLAEACNVTKQTANKILKRLFELGAGDCDKPNPAGGRNPFIYRRLHCKRRLM